MPNDGNNNQNNPQEVNNNPQPQEVNQAPQQPAQNKVDLQKHLDLAQDELDKQEQVLDLLKKRQVELQSYNSSQNELLEKRQNEINNYDYEKRQAVTINIQDLLPETIEDLNKIKDPQKMETTRIYLDKVIAEKKETDAKDYKLNETKMTLSGIDEYEKLTSEIDKLRADIKADEGKSLTAEEWKWFKNTTDTKSADFSIVEGFRELDANTKKYQEKQQRYERLYPEGGDNNKEFEVYQSMVAKRMMLKQVIKQVGMPKNTVKSFAELDGYKKDPKQQAKFAEKSANLLYNLATASAKGSKELSEIGYDDPNKVMNILNDYYAVEKQVNDYAERIAKNGNSDQKKWIKDHSSTKIGDYFKNGKLMDKYQKLKTLSEQYDPSYDYIADRIEVQSERNKVIFPYYKSLQCKRLIQREGINNAITKENAQIKDNNKIEEQKKKEADKWKDQKACDAQYKKAVEQKAAEATKKRRKMMIGSTLVGFAANLSSSIGDTIQKAGVIAAEGIVKGERVQVEKELEALQQKKNTQATALSSNMYNKVRSIQDAKKHLQQQNAQIDKEFADKINKADQHQTNATKAYKKYEELTKKVEEKKKELEEAKKKEAKKLKEIEENISGKKLSDNEKALKKNEIESAENYMTGLAADINAAKQNIPTANPGGMSQELLQDLMTAKTETRKIELNKEETKILNDSKALKEQMANMQKISTELSSYLTPDNLGKVDTIVSIAEKLYSAYSTVSEFLDGQAAEDKKEEDKKEDKKDEKEEDKKDEAEAEAEEDEDNFELNIKDTIQDLRDKAEAINNAISGKGEGAEDKETIIGNITELAQEAGQIVQIVSQKLNDMTVSMQHSLEEAQAREETEKNFLKQAELNSEESIVERAQKELTEQQNLHKTMIRADLDANQRAIDMQTNRVENSKASRDKVLEDMGKLLEFEEAERKKQLEKEEKELQEKAKQEAEIEDTPEIQAAREELNAAKARSDEMKDVTNAARKEYEIRLGSHQMNQEILDLKKSQLQLHQDNLLAKMDEAKKLQNDDKKTQKQKNEDFLKQKKEAADAAGSAIRKAAVKSFFVGIADSAADFSKGFMDKLTLTVSESVVKGKVKQMEDELSEKEDTYRLKGETALAKGRSQLQHVKEAEMRGKDAPQYKPLLEYAADDERRAKDIHKERDEIGKEIEKMQEDLAGARVEEKKQLDELHQKLKDSYHIDFEAEAKKIDIKTGVNEAAAHQATKQIAEDLENGKDIVDLLTSPAYTEVDAAQRQVIKEQVKLKAAEKELENDAKDIEKYSNALKGLFTPKNMGRVETVVSAAETIYKLYGSVKGFINGKGGSGDQNEDEEEKSIAEKISDMKKKAADVRKGMMGEGEPKEDEPGIVDNIIAITQSMREVTDTLSTKIKDFAEEYENDLTTQRGIKINADWEYNEFKEIFKKEPEKALDKAFVEVVYKSESDIVTNQQESIQYTEGAMKETEEKMKAAEEDLRKKEKEQEDVDKKVEDAQKKLDDLIAAEKQKKADALKAQQEENARQQEALKQQQEERRRREEENAQREANERRLAEEREREADRLRTLHEKNDLKMEQLQDLLDNLTDTKNGYAGHDNTTEYGKVIDQLQKFTGDTDKNIDFSKENTKDLKDALTGYLNHVGMDTAWHRNGNVRKENVLAALNIIDPETAKIFEQQANNVRRKSKQLDLNTLMEKEGIKRPDEKRRNRQPSAQSAQNVKKEEKLPDLNSQIVSRK